MASLFMLPNLNAMARDLELGSPTTVARKGDATCPTGVLEGSPHARRTEAVSATAMLYAGA